MSHAFLAKSLVVAATTAGLFTVAATDASAGWAPRGQAFAPHSVSSSHTWTGLQGRTWSRSGSTSCANGTCNRSETYTRPNGKTVTTNDSVTRTGRGQFNSSETVTGPNGKTVTRTGQTDCGRFACERSATITGPNGGSESRGGWWWR